MDLYVLFRYVHFIAIFVVVACLSGEWILVKTRMTRQEIHRVWKIDSVYGIGAIILVAAGLTLWFGVGKPAELYSKNWIFHLKVALALLLGILSLPPTIFFYRNRNKENYPGEVMVPNYVRRLIFIELLIVASIPLCAVLMAQGYGYFG